MTKAQREMLRVLAVGPRQDITNESIVKALARKGYAERFSESIGYMAQRHAWRITDAGRAALGLPQ